MPTTAESSNPVFNEADNALPPLKIPLDPPSVNLQSRDEVMAYCHDTLGMMATWWANWFNVHLNTCVRRAQRCELNRRRDSINSDSPIHSTQC